MEKIGKALGSIVRSALDFLKSLIKKINMKDIAQAVVDTLKGFFSTVNVADAVSVILTVIAAKLAASASTFVFDTAAAAIMGSLSGAIASAGFTGIAETIMNSIGAAISAVAPPVAIGAAAVAGLSLAFSALDKAIEEETQLEIFGDRLDNITGRIQNQTQAIKDRTQASMNYVKEAGAAEANMASDLADRYFDLAEKENRTNEETEEMRRLAELLVNKLPELQNYYNEQTGLLDVTRQAVDDLIESRLQEIKLAAVEDKLKEAYEDQVDALDNLKAAIEPANQAQKYMNELNEEYQALLDKIDQMVAYDSLSDQINSCTGDTDALLRQQEELWNEITNGGAETFPTFDSLHQKMGEVSQKLYDFRDEYSEALGTLSDAKEAYSAVETNISELTDMLTTGMTQAADYAASGYADEMASDTSMADSTLKQAENLLKEFNRELDINSPSGKFREAAGYAIEGWNIGVEENRQTAIDIIRSLADSLVEAFRPDTWAEAGAQMLNAVMNTVEAFKASWTESFMVWREENAALFFGYDVWHEQFRNFLLAYNDINEEFMEAWQANMEVWWNDMVEPFFGMDRWKAFGTQMKDGIIMGLKSIVSEIGGLLNTIIILFDTAFKKLEEAMNDLIEDYNKAAAKMGTPTLDRVSYKAMGTVTIPKLATGAVIRGGNPFMAILGDQPAGRTNIEAPAGLIKDMVAQGIAEAGIGSGQSIPVNINVIYDGETTARVMIPDILAELGRQGYNVDLLGYT